MISDLVKEHELLVFTTCLADRFEAIRELRHHLQHPDNIARVEAFADTVNGAWRELCEEKPTAEAEH